MKPFIFLLLAAACIISCKKEEAAKCSNTQLISQQTWKLIAGTQQQLPAGTLQDVYAPMAACYRDDEFVYKSDLTYEGKAGAVKCNAADPQIFATGTWKFINNETQVERITDTGIGMGTVVFSVMALSETQLILKATEGGFEYILTFSH